MCGIIGVISTEHSTESLIPRIEAGMRTLSHRGPDGQGVAVDRESNVVLGHRRLAIIDPEHGQQPLHSLDGDLSIVFNGAIYNYLELRRELTSLGHPIQTYSDTEVILYAYREWGEACLDRFLGMFAFTILDRRNRRLFCARDRIGIKPFYYHFNGSTLIFASEIKAILATRLVHGDSNPEGLLDYITFQFCLGGKTLFKDIRKLEPGHSLTIQLTDDSISMRERRYWDLQYEIDDSHDEAWFIDHLAGLIEDSTRIHLRSDVPLGAHLSGGLDSSTIVCLATEILKGEKLKTFTGAFSEGPEFDETGYARLVAEFAGTDYHEVFIRGSDFPEILPKLMYYMDEPLAGPGVIPQYFVSRMAAEHVKVVLGGQGGDEIFIGYARYLVSYLEKCLSGAIFETSDLNPYAVTLESIVPNLPLLGSYTPMLQGLWRDGLFGPSDRRYFKLLDRSEGMASLFNQDLLTSNYSPFESFAGIFNGPGMHSLVNQMTHFDLKGSLPALLHVEDRTSMAASIESRVPLLDHRIVELMATIPPNIKFSGGRMKHLFKEAVRNRLPKAIIDRKDKMGFPTPLTHWIKGESKDFVIDTLQSKRARERGVYDVAAVDRAMQGENEYGRVTWGLLCLELWHQTFVDQTPDTLEQLKPI